jgi:hypothetical protein
MKNTIKLGLCSAAAALAIATTAHAVPNQDGIRWSFDNGTTWSATSLDADGDGSISGAIVGSGYNLDFVVGHTYPFTGTAARPDMDLSISGVRGGGTLLVQFSALDFTPIPSGSYLTVFGLTAGAPAHETTTIGVGGNALFAAGVNASTIGGSIGTYTSSLSAPVAGQTAPYAITMSVNFDQGGGGTVSVDSHLTVPDGGNTLMLLGSALSALGFVTFRKSRKA